MAGKINGWRLVGEFLVIFIGVMLAFSADRWWESRRLHEEERFALESIKEDLAKDTSVYNGYQIPHNTQKVENLRLLIGFLKEKDFQPSMENMSIAQSVMGVNNWPVTKTYYNSLKENGNLKIIRDKRLRASLVNYYEALSGNTQFANESHLQYLRDYLMPYILENADLIKLENSLSILRDKKFQNMVVMLINSLELKIKEYQKVSGYSSELIKEIEQYLEKSEI
jgi:hypothetical protein